jgi:threonine/homoserine/homoserine lactone efflux protein
MTLVLVAVLLALAYCAAPGPVIVEATRRGLANGFRAALAVELGSLAGDVFWVGFMFLGAATLARAGGLRLATGVAGGAFLLWVGIRALSAAQHGRTRSRGSAMIKRAFAAGAVISVASAYAPPFWLGVSSSLSGYGISSGNAAEYMLFSIAFLLTCVAFALFAAAAISWGRRFLHPRFFSAVELVAGLILTVLGIDLLGFAVAHVIG